MRIVVSSASNRWAHSSLGNPGLNLTTAWVKAPSASGPSGDLNRPLGPLGITRPRLLFLPYYYFAGARPPQNTNNSIATRSTPQRASQVQTCSSKDA
jgi:hypothetical protein